MELSKVSFLGHVLLLICCFIIFWKYRSSAKTTLNTLAIFSIIFSIYILVTIAPIQQKNYSKLLEIGNTNNVIIIVMDMFQGYFVSKYLDDNPEIWTDFEGFIHFDNAVSAAPYTTVSTRYILTGESPQLSIGPTAVIDQNDNLLVDAINNGYATSYVSATVPVSTPALNEYSANINFVEKNKYIKFAYTCAIRYFPKKFMPTLFSSPLEFGWMSKTNSRDSFLWFSQNLVLQPNVEKSFHYYHNLMTHQPIRFDSKGVYSRKRSSNDLYGEVEFAMNTLKLLFTRLKKIGKYNDTTIIILGDHGYNLFSQLSKLNFLPLNAQYLLDKIGEKHKGQYEVSLFVKNRNSSGSMRRVNTAVVLSDLRKTINEIMLPESGLKFKGINILQKELPFRRKVKILSYTNKRFTDADYQRFDNWKPAELDLPLSGSIDQ
ncbi:MAG: sulfatase [uncultured bacterium]|nr:MAG: sulfatase [uncultured bacterium]